MLHTLRQGKSNLFIYETLIAANKTISTISCHTSDSRVGDFYDEKLT